MGQKTNSIIFNLKINNSNFKYNEKNKEESSLLLYKTLQTQDYINTTLLFYNIFTHSCKIEYTDSKINILILFFKLSSKTKQKTLNKTTKQLISFIITNVLAIGLNMYFKHQTIEIKTKNLNEQFDTNILKQKEYLLEYKKVIKLFKKFLKNIIYKDLIKILFITVCEKKSAKLLADTISFYLRKHKKKHYYLFFLLKKTLNSLINLKFSTIKGIKITVSGRLNGVPRSKSKTLQIGILPLQSFTSNIDYYNSTSYTSNGTFGVKVWICEI